jgi:hypothetical protein
MFPRSCLAQRLGRVPCDARRVEQYKSNIEDVRDERARSERTCLGFEPVTVQLKRATPTLEAWGCTMIVLPCPLTLGTDEP